MTENQGTAAASPASARVDYIDGLRASAALWVAAHHAIIISEPTTLMALPVVGPFVATLFFGQCAVMLFLLLSGFCLYFPCVSKNKVAPRSTLSYGAYLKRRFTRLAPPYYSAGALCLLMAAFPQLAVGSWAATGPVDAKVVASHVALVHNLIPSHSAKIDYPMWSIGLEWQLYLFFPLLVWSFRRASPWLIIAATFILSGVIRAGHLALPADVAPLLRDGPLAYLHIFGLGMLVAMFTVRHERVAPNWLLGCVAATSLLAIRFGSGGGLVHDTASSIFGCCILLLAADASGRVARALSQPWLVFVGVFSYSIYLIHAPLLHLVWYAIHPRLNADSLFLVLILSLGPIVAVCYLFHCVFERPFMRAHKPTEKAATFHQVAHGSSK